MNFTRSSTTGAGFFFIRVVKTNPALRDTVSSTRIWLTPIVLYIIRNYYEELQQRIGLAPPDPLGFLVHDF